MELLRNMRLDALRSRLLMQPGANITAVAFELGLPAIPGGWLPATRPASKSFPARPVVDTTEASHPNSAISGPEQIHFRFLRKALTDEPARRCTLRRRRSYSPSAASTAPLLPRPPIMAIPRRFNGLAPLYENCLFKSTERSVQHEQVSHELAEHLLRWGRGAVEASMFKGATNRLQVYLVRYGAEVT